MQVKLTTQITTIIELSPGVTVEEARKEIFARYQKSLDEESFVDDILAAQDSSILYDRTVGTEVNHTFGDANE